MNVHLVLQVVGIGCATVFRSKVEVEVPVLFVDKLKWRNIVNGIALFDLFELECVRSYQVTGGALDSHRSGLGHGGFIGVISQ